MKSMGIQICFYQNISSGPLDFTAKIALDLNLENFEEAHELEKKLLESIFVYIVFLKPHFTVLKEKKKKIDKNLCLELPINAGFLTS